MSSFSLALITGASSGIGEALAHLLASKGISLILTGQNEAKLTALAQQLSEKVSTSVVIADLSQPNELRKVLDIIYQKRPNLIINSAGYGKYGDVLTAELQEELKMVDVNVKALMAITIEGARTLVSHEKKGVILNISSASAFYLFPSFTTYAASKAFVNEFSQSMDLETERYGVRILCCCPGMVKTGFARRAGGVKTAKEGLKSMATEEVARMMWHQIEQLVPLKIIDWRYRLSLLVSYLLPSRWLALRLKKQIDQRYPPQEIKKSPYSLEIP